MLSLHLRPITLAARGLMLGMQSSALLAGRRMFSVNTKPKAKDQVMTIEEALKLCSALARGHSNETVEAGFNLGIDPRKPGQNLRGAISLPHGNGNTIRIAVVARNEKAAEAKAAGADVVGFDDLIQQIQSGNINFDRLIATPDCMGQVARVAKILGPRNLMPNPKLGTVTQDVAAAIKLARQGQVEYRAEKQGQVALPIGKISFTPQQLLENYKTVVQELLAVAPKETVGLYMRQAYVKTTQGDSFFVDIDLPPFVASKAAQQK